MMMKRVFRAATLAEVALVMAIIAIISATGMGAAINYYQRSILSADVDQLVIELRRTRQRAISNSIGSGYSVKFLMDRFVIFPGAVYNPSNPENEDNFLETGVIVSTTFPNDELTLDTFTGRASNPGAVTISAYGNLTQVVAINSLGIIESVE
jgi:hypothetical protein